jgi:hypothetical protein
MNYISVLKENNVNVNEYFKTNFRRNKHSSDKTNNSPSLDNLISEGDENIINYLKWNGLANDANLLVLSSKSHYYYDSEELKEVTTLINLKKLNRIKHLNEFLQTLCYGLSPKTNFVGCFSDRKSQKRIMLISRMYKKFINFLDSRIDIEIDDKSILKVFESVGFRVINMTEIHGMTYFIVQSLCKNG